MKTENKGIVKNGFFSVIQLLVSTACYIVIYYMILSKLGKAELGIWSIMSSVPAALTIFGSGVSGCLLRYVPIYTARNDVKQLTQIIFNGTVFNILIALTAVLVGFYLCMPVLKFLFSINAVPQLYTLIFNATLVVFFLNFVSSVFLFTLDGLQLIYKRNIIVMITSFFFCVAAMVFINFYGLPGLLYAQILQSLALAFLSLYLLKRAGVIKLRYCNFSKSHFRLFLGYGQNFQFISIAIMLFEPLTKYFLNRYFNLSIVGLYDIVNRVVTQIRTVIVSAIMVIVPVVSKLQEENDLNINELYKKAVRGGSLLSIISYSSIVVIAVPVLTRLDKKDLSLYLVFLLALSIAYTFNIISSCAYSIFMGLGRLKAIIVCHLLSTGINMGLFLLVTYKPIPYLMILPPALAIILSSLYIVFEFRKKLKIDNFSITREDARIYMLSGCSVIGSLLFYLLSTPPYYLYLLIGLYSISVLWSTLNNAFLLGIFHTLIPLHRKRDET